MAKDSPAAKERAALCDLLREVGPDAPTLCEGWTTADLVAHLFVRERRPIAAIGLLGGPFAALTTRSMERAKRQGFDRLVDRVAGGPPFFARPFDATMNLHEFFVHHEDVRRARPDWKPRRDPELDDALWALLRRSARLMSRRIKGVGLQLVRPDHVPITARRGEPQATIEGSAQEVVLYLFGRREVAQVEIEGPPEAVEAVRDANLHV